MTNKFLNTTTRNVHWLMKAHESGELHMEPPFQRNPVWLERQKSFLIDTVLSGLPIPEIYMQDTVNEDGEAQYVVVDGQQRLRAVLEFVEGRFAIDAKDSPKWADMTFEDLSPADKKQVYSYDFVVRLLPEMNNTDLREVFQRLNRNVIALNKQELRQATYWGPFIECMNSISNWDEWSSLGLFSPNDVRRMLDVEFISELTIALLNGHQNKKAKLDHYYEIYEDSFEEGSKVKRVFQKILGEFEQVLPNIAKSRWSKKTDFYTLFLVFAKHQELIPLSSENRYKATEVLEKFADGINAFVKSDESDRKDLGDNVSLYGSGIRASTDLGSRRRRFEALEAELGGVF